MLHICLSGGERLQAAEERGIAGLADSEETFSSLMSGLGSSEEVEPQIKALARSEHAVEQGSSEDEVEYCRCDRERQQYDVFEPVEPQLEMEDERVSY